MYRGRDDDDRRGSSRHGHDCNLQRRVVEWPTDLTATATTAQARGTLTPIVVCILTVWCCKSPPSRVHEVPARTGRYNHTTWCVLACSCFASVDFGLLPPPVTSDSEGSVASHGSRRRQRGDDDFDAPTARSGKAKRSRRSRRVAQSCLRRVREAAALWPFGRASTIIAAVVLAGAAILAGTIGNLYTRGADGGGGASELSAVTQLANTGLLLRASLPLRFSAVQNIPTLGSRDTDTFVVDGVTYLVVSNTVNNAGDTASPVLYRWDVTASEFVVVQIIGATDCYDSAPFVIDDVQYVAIASTVRCVCARARAVAVSWTRPRRRCHGVVIGRTGWCHGLCRRTARYGAGIAVANCWSWRRRLLTLTAVTPTTCRS